VWLVSMCFRRSNLFIATVLISPSTDPRLLYIPCAWQQYDAAVSISAAGTRDPLPMLVVLGATADKVVVSDRGVTNLSPCRIYYSFLIFMVVLVLPWIDHPLSVRSVFLCIYYYVIANMFVRCNGRMRSKI
jgi:hypothetical protein